MPKAQERKTTTKDKQSMLVRAGALKPTEAEAVDEIARRTGRSISEVVRRACVELLKLDEKGAIDWATAID